MDERGGSPDEEKVRLAYADEAYGQDRHMSWPPGRNEPHTEVLDGFEDLASRASASMRGAFDEDLPGEVERGRVDHRFVGVDGDDLSPRLTAQHQ
ncbi:hypothetical protein [Virgisporangium aurantiacum]|uniref:Uncharacterized protein n=1 Tax=Virgisporangium aurantiacum TaxID=175570 RepID=A0A8J3ZI45_9ACTN|nr:hypothetical protein [Virgisporangium aurantiacum]GIJ64639.1 hypothetical protein Vau01_121550 [Virgisporangium aurantiacum]